MKQLKTNPSQEQENAKGHKIKQENKVGTATVGSADERSDNQSSQDSPANKAK